MTRRSRVAAVAVAVAAVAGGATPGCRDEAAGPRSDDPSRPVAAPTAPGPGGTAPTAPVVRFVDATAEAGLTAVLHCGGADKDHILESTGSGAAFLDYDADGRIDVYLVNGWTLDEDPSAVRVRGRNVLYRNVGGGRFADVTDEAGVGDPGWGGGACVADFDGDGRVDLYVTNFGPNRLFRNRGDGGFEEVGASAGVDDAGWGAGAAFFDADGDGDLDLYVANYIDCTLEDVLGAERTSLWRNTARTMAGPFGLRGGRDRFYRNNGDGTFRDATDEAGLTDTAEAYGLGVLASDLDLDGDVDLYVANDSNPNFIYRNEGDGTFTDVGAWSGAAFGADGAAQAGMGVDAGDVDGDGRPDLIVTNFARDYCTLYRNLGDLYFDDVSRSHDLGAATMTPLSWGCAFLDADQDGDLDLVIVNGHIYPQVEEFPELRESYRQRPMFFRNDAGRLVEATDAAGPGFAVTRSARGVAVGDYDDDGDLDLLVTAIDAPPLLLRNETAAAGHWLQLRLLDRRGAPSVNARAVVTIAGASRGAEVRSGSSYQSQSATDLHFGLGPHAIAERVEIIWPDGSRTERRDVGADQRIVVRQEEAPPPGSAVR